MKYRFANIISHVFHPLFMPSLGLLFFYFSSQLEGFSYETHPDLLDRNLVLIFVSILFSLIIPSIAVYILKKKGMIESYHMHKKEERFLPFAITGISIFLGYYFLFDILRIETEPVIKIFYLGCLLSIIGALAISLRWKISVHMIGIGGFTGAVFLLSKLSGQVFLIDLICAIVIAGLVAYSRLKLNAHSGAQVVAGFLLGFFCESFSLFYY